VVNDCFFFWGGGGGGVEIWNQTTLLGV